MRYIILILLFILPDLLAAAMPVDRAKVTSTFGESRKDHFHNGIDFGGGEQEVYAVRDAKMIFYYDKAEFPFDNYPGSGNYIILDHSDTRSYYMHLKDNSINKSNYSIKGGSYIGMTSDTGHSSGIHLHFGYEKKRPYEILNPLFLFQDLVEDKFAPRIEHFFIKTDDSNLIPVLYYYQAKPGAKINLYVQAYDLIQDYNGKISPYKLTSYVNDNKLREYVFDKLRVNDNLYYSPPDYSFTNIYYDQFIYNMGDFQAQEAIYNIKIVVEDFSGNSVKTEKQLKIR